MLAAVGSLVLWRTGSEAASYRDALEAGWAWSYYQHHTTSFGLRVVPIAALVGAFAAALLTLASSALLVLERRVSTEPAGNAAAS